LRLLNEGGGGVRQEIGKHSCDGPVFVRQGSRRGLNFAQRLLHPVIERHELSGLFPGAGQFARVIGLFAGANQDRSVAEPGL